MRIVLFGSRSVHPISMIALDYPLTLDGGVSREIPDMSPVQMRQALALSVGIILARAATAPPATFQDDAAGGSDHHAVAGRALPYTASTPNAVRLVLPKPELWDTSTCLEWDHLEPWQGINGGAGLSEHLLTYTISLPSNGSPDPNWTDEPSSSDHNWTDGPSSSAVKRQKLLHLSSLAEGGGSFDYSDDEDEEGRGRRDFDYQCTELAHATAQFLLETSSLDWFQRPGGVLLVAMSLALSRGIPILQSDMDDRTARLTSNFGHCSQELINLLLTGQAGEWAKFATS